MSHNQRNDQNWQHSMLANVLVIRYLRLHFKYKYGTHIYIIMHDYINYIYRIYLIKRPGIDFLAASVEGRLNEMGAYSKRAFIVLSTSNSCSSAVIMLFLAALSFNLKS